MHRPLLPAAAALVAASIVASATGCAGGPSHDLTPRPRAPARGADVGVPSTATPSPSLSPTAAAAAARADSLEPLGDGAALLVPAARIGDDRIEEGSGLAYAGGYWWTHNDSGDGPFLFRSKSPWFDTAERIEVPGATAVDWEELAVLDGDLLICDIGDNDRVRDDVTIYRARPTDSGLERVATYPVTYPDGKHDAEGVFVWAGRVHIVIKNRGEDATYVYRFDDLRDGATNTPTRIGSVNIPEGEQVTAADSNADGVVALLTYSQLLIWPADDVSGDPRQAFTLHARQCEALAWTETGIIFTNEQRDAYFVDRPLACSLDPWLAVADRVQLERVPSGADGRPALDLLADLPVRNRRDGEYVRMGLARGRLVIAATLEIDGELVPSTDRLGTSLLLTFGSEPRLRVTPGEAQIAIVLAPLQKVGAVAIDLGGGQSLVDAEAISVEAAGENGTVSMVIEIPVATLFPEGLPRRFRMALAGNGFRGGDDEPLLGALDMYSLMRPFAWAVIHVE